jgi:hypothetical protein
MARKYTRLSVKKIAAAIPGTGGLIARICKITGYSWGAVRDFINAHPDLEKMVRDEEEIIDDAAESTVIKKILDGDDASARWWLARRRRAKYGETLAVTGKDGGPIKTEDVTNYTDDERISKLTAILERARQNRDRQVATPADTDG